MYWSNEGLDLRNLLFMNLATPLTRITSFLVRDEYNWLRLTVTDSKVLVLSRSSVDVYDTDGLFVRSFGEGTLKKAYDITAANDGRVMVVDWGDSCVHIFSEDGQAIILTSLNSKDVRVVIMPELHFTC